MAFGRNRDGDEPPADQPREFSEADKSKARQWFEKATGLREKQNYDFALECYVTGLRFWPEAVEEGHKPLWSLAVQRRQAGGKKPGMMEALKKPMTGKDALQAMLNAELLLGKDPTNGTYFDGLLKNAVKAGLLETVKWIAPRALDSLKADKKVSAARFKAFRAALVEAAERADRLGDGETAALCYEQAVLAVEALLTRNPTDMALRDEQRDLAGKLTITKGKYVEAGSFRDSLQDAGAQKLLHDKERVKQGEQTLEALIGAARAEVRGNPGVAGKINALVDVLLKRERAAEEYEAIALLTDAFEQSDNYSFKVRADEIRLRQGRREARVLVEKAKQSGTPDDAQQARLAQMAFEQLNVDIHRERAHKYPTDLRVRYRLGEALYRAKEYDEAIPALQAAQSDPRYRVRALNLIGLSFFDKESYSQAAEVLKDGLEAYEGGDDDLEKLLIYWLGRSYEAGGQVEDAKATYGKLLRIDYNYANGDARQRLEALGKA